MRRFQSVRGMQDYLPEETIFWQNVEKTIKDILSSYGYSEIRLPIVENTDLFYTSVGIATDIAKKEMYSFSDRSGDDLSLRPEGTASCIRAGIEHGLLYGQEEKRLWYIGPMFRYERPQKGRYRQFYQIGVEIFGNTGPHIDAELILIGYRCWKSLGIDKYVSLEINSIGSLDERSRYCQALTNFLHRHKSQLDDSYHHYIKTNPIRILDTKNPDIQFLLKKAPSIIDFLGKDSRSHFHNLCKLLDEVNIIYTINPHLVRGLDYYNKTVFEWITDQLGTQNTICGGGRYDELVKKLGGKSTPAMGFAIGLDRLILIIKLINSKFSISKYIDVYFAVSKEEFVKLIAFRLGEKLRNEVPLIHLITDYKSKSFKEQLIYANKYHARIVLILGKREALIGKVIIKDLLTGYQELLTQDELSNKIVSILKQNTT